LPEDVFARHQEGGRERVGLSLEDLVPRLGLGVQDEMRELVCRVEAGARLVFPLTPEDDDRP